MQGQLLSISDFEQYIENNTKPALQLVGTNLKKPGKLNQVAARMLGFKTYEEKLQPFHARERKITDSVHFERCPHQGNRPTFKALNIIVVLDEAGQCIRARLLRAGEELEYVTEDNQTHAIRYDHEDEPTPSFNNVVIENANDWDFERGNDQQHRITFHFTVTLPDGSTEQNYFALTRTYEGIIIDTYYDLEREHDCYDSMGLMFSDIDDDDYVWPNQALADINHTLSAAEGDYYQWLKPAVIDGERRFLAIDTDGGSKPNISGMLFDSPKAAKDAILDGRWDFEPEDMDGCVIVHVRKSLQETFIYKE